MPSKFSLAGKSLPPGIAKATPIDTSPRRFFAMAQGNLQQYDYPGSGGMLTKTLDQAIEAAEMFLAKQNHGMTYYIMEIKKVVRSEATVTTKVEDLSDQKEEMPEHSVLKFQVGPEAYPADSPAVAESQPDTAQEAGQSSEQGSLLDPPGF